jgi:hypothetical protein
VAHHQRQALGRLLLSPYLRRDTWPPLDVQLRVFVRLVHETVEDLSERFLPETIEI